MSQDVEALIRGARLPEDTVDVCMRADLVAEHERLERDLVKARRMATDSLAGGGEARVAAQIRALEDEMETSTVVFKLRAMPRPTWKAFVAAHPPRKNDDGEVHERDGMGVNSDTFFPAIIRRCTIAPELSDELWRVLLGDDDAAKGRLRAEGREDEIEEGKLTDRQFDQLANTAWYLNRGDVDVPFSRAASRILDSEPESN